MSNDSRHTKSIRLSADEEARIRYAGNLIGIAEPSRVIRELSLWRAGELIREHDGSGAKEESMLDD